MVVPLIPIWLAILGQGPVALGLIEGVADAFGSVLKLWAGRHSDAISARKGMALAGYGLSNVMRPLIGLAGSGFSVLLLRVGDRFGKGIRTAPRDAMLAEAAPAAMRGYVFGFHRAMDNIGAVGGALIAALILARHLGLKGVLLGSAIPGLIAVLLMAFVVVEVRSPGRVSRVVAPISWSGLPAGLRRYLAVLAVFAFAKVSEIFLVLRAHEEGFPAVRVLLLWALFNAAKAATSGLGGRMADRFGNRRVLRLSWTAHALGFVWIGFAGSQWLWAAVALYGLFAGFGEGAERARIGDLAADAEHGTAFGWYYLVTGAMAIPGGALFGLVWHIYDARTAFGLSSLLMALAALALRGGATRPKAGF